MLIAALIIPVNDTTFCHRIAEVFFAGHGLKMCGIDTPFVIADVMNVHPFRDWTNE
jgi:hypothetical protein